MADVRDAKSMLLEMAQPKLSGRVWYGEAKLHIAWDRTPGPVPADPFHENAHSLLLPL
jgi:hypothetical protein